MTLRGAAAKGRPILVRGVGERAHMLRASVCCVGRISERLFLSNTSKSECVLVCCDD